MRSFADRGAVFKGHAGRAVKKRPALTDILLLNQIPRISNLTDVAERNKTIENV